jgi:hypothetical protein
MIFKFELVGCMLDQDKWPLVMIQQPLQVFNNCMSMPSSSPPSSLSLSMLPLLQMGDEVCHHKDDHTDMNRSMDSKLPMVKHQRRSSSSCTCDAAVEVERLQLWISQHICEGDEKAIQLMVSARRR